MQLSFRLLIIAIGLLVHSIQAVAADILEEIDMLRLPSEQVSLQFVISTSDGTTTRFTSDHDGKGSSLATIVSKGNRGEKYLFTPKGLWLFAPGSRRTIRIPKIQSLRGETVVGDITQLRFADEYQVDQQTPIEHGGKNAIKLHLLAKSRSSMFRTIDLTVDAQSFAPINAEYFLTSGRLFRSAEFSTLEPIPFDKGTREGIAKIVFKTPTGSSTSLSIERIDSQSFPNGHFNPSTIQR